MEDSEIITLYWNRDERAIAETGTKYGPFCQRIAQNILTVREDARGVRQRHLSAGVDVHTAPAPPAAAPLAGAGGAQLGHQPVAQRPRTKTVRRFGSIVQ